MSTQPLTIEQKLLEIGKAVQNLSKDRTNEEDEFDFVSANKIFETFNELFEHYGLIIVPSVKDIRIDDILTTVTMFYRIMDCTSAEVIELQSAGQGEGVRGIFKAQTGAHKYLFKNLFRFSDREDDPDAGGETIKHLKGNKKAFAKNVSKNNVLIDKEPNENPWMWRIECTDNMGFDKPLLNFELADLLEGLEESPDKFSKNDTQMIKQCKKYPKLQEAAKLAWQKRAATVQSQQFDDDDIEF